MNGSHYFLHPHLSPYGSYQGCVILINDVHVLNCLRSQFNRKRLLKAYVLVGKEARISIVNV